MDLEKMTRPEHIKPKNGSSNELISFFTQWMMMYNKETPLSETYILVFSIFMPDISLLFMVFLSLSLTHAHKNKHTLTDLSVELDSFPQTAVQLSYSLPASFQGDGRVYWETESERERFKYKTEGGKKKCTYSTAYIHTQLWTHRNVLSKRPRSNEREEPE